VLVSSLTHTFAPALRQTLLRVTDVERQPLRSMGFVSVIIVSVLFALGLPLARRAYRW